MARLTCAECGRVARPGATVCPVDGSPLVERPDPAENAGGPAVTAPSPAATEPCAECGKPLRPAENPCGRCGTPRRVVAPPVASHTHVTLGDAASEALDGGDPWADEEAVVRLVVSGPRGNSREVTLSPGDAIQIGRSVGPFTDLAGDNVSGTHALLTVGDGCVHVTDVGRDGRGSTNGTYVDGQRIRPNDPVEVRSGSTVTCAQDPPLTIRVEIE